MEGINCPPVTLGPDQIPPVGLALRLIGGSLRQIDPIGGIVITGNGFTTIVVVLLVGQFPPILYVIVCDPTPAATGLNIIPVTPLPLNTPPLGVAVSVTELELMHNGFVGSITIFVFSKVITTSSSAA